MHGVSIRHSHLLKQPESVSLCDHLLVLMGQGSASAVPNPFESHHLSFLSIQPSTRLGKA